MLIFSPRLSQLNTSALMRCVRISALAVGSLLWASRALCQSEPDSAEALYQRGIEAFNAGNYVVACRSLSESYRLDPQLGALFTEATCEMRAGKIATAAQHYLDFMTRVDALPAEARQRQLERRAAAAQQRGVLLPQIPTLRVEVRGQSVTPPRLTLNGNVLSQHSLGVALSLDPGDQILEQRSSSGAATVKRITLAPGEHQTLVLELAADAPSSPHPGVSTNQRQPSGSALPYVLGGVGVVGLGVGGVAGMIAIGKKGVVNDECNGTSCSARGLNAANDGKRDALVSTIGFAAGVAALSTGLVLVLSAPEKPRQQSQRSALVFAGDRLLWRGAF